MKKQELIKLINSFTTDIEFKYNSKFGAIIPLKMGENITIGYGEDDDVVVKTAEEVMAYPFIDGKCLNEICEEIDFG